jgi:hypothetical protein
MLNIVMLSVTMLNVMAPINLLLGPAELYMIVIYSFLKQARVFVTDSYFHPNLIFVGKPSRSPYF